MTTMVNATLTKIQAKYMIISQQRSEIQQMFCCGLATVFANTTSVESDFSILKWEKYDRRTDLTCLALEGYSRLHWFITSLPLKTYSSCMESTNAIKFIKVTTTSRDAAAIYRTRYSDLTTEGSVDFVWGMGIGSSGSERARDECFRMAPFSVADLFGEDLVMPVQLLLLLRSCTSCASLRWSIGEIRKASRMDAGQIL
ncbi:hypothetical protein AXG93_4773s1400 [Marchantia polymorpha subsp. ruderalis]|uniref:Uncharacterized protein n=1 Tax=Marchantia polymorpha subsp. ruderalis TaxID=1480154 RepID=A0A176WJ55_MARPO|nr:hypothetical protein AXG93_4773s1400 [Marchantia polymorpha subsp. ruderalis]